MYRIILVLTLLMLSIITSADSINPLLFVNSSYPAPIGIVSYGLLNLSSDSGPYSISTNEVFGYARIDAIYAYNETAAQELNVSAWGVTLQQNVMLNISSNGHTHVYWLQNVADLNTSNMTYFFVNNVWNSTTINASISNSTLVGGGGVSGQGNQSFYSYAQNSTPYELPFVLEPIIKIAYNGSYPYVQFGYRQNGYNIFYDNVTILIPGKASIVVTGYNQTGNIPNSLNNSQFFDAELVFGGEANGATIPFIRMNSTLWSGYLNNNGSITAFPSFATFGSDTQENATNLKVTKEGAYALVQTGQPNYNETLTLSGVPPGLNLSSSNKVTPTTTRPMQTITQSAILQNPPSGTVGAPSAGPYLVLGTAILCIMIVILVLAYLRAANKGKQVRS